MSLTSAPAVPGNQTGTWDIDPVHSDVPFVVRHMVASKVRGRFGTLEGTIGPADDPPQSRAEIRINDASVDTSTNQRVAHVRSNDFRDTHNDQNITFASTSKIYGSPLAVMECQHTKIAESFNRVHDENLDRSAEVARMVTHIASHIAVERNYLYPLAKKIGHRHSRPSHQLISDYRKMQTLLVKIDRRKTNSPDMPDLVAQLHDAFEQHQRRCAAISACIEEHVDRPDLDALARQMASAKRVIVSHPHPILLRVGGPLYGRITRIASHWDSWRDQTVRNR
jgi:YceI-like domain